MDTGVNAYSPTDRSMVKRLHERGHYDRDTVHAVLDASMMAHIAYVIDGQPYVTPTAFWRDGDVLYWHGSSASRMLRTQSAGIPVCVTVTHLDGLVLARSGFHHSINYRSVMAFGKARKVEDLVEKERELNRFIDRIYPGRNATMRGIEAQELKATTLLAMEIEEASAKVRAKGVADDDEDYELPIYAERIPVRTVLGAPEPCPRLLDGVTRPATLNGYSEGRLLEDALRDAYFVEYPNG